MKNIIIQLYIKLVLKINNEINNLNSDTINIELPIINKKADGINLKKIHDEIYKQAQDAYITQNPLTVHPNVNGVDFAISIEEAEELLKEEKENHHGAEVLHLQALR